MQNVIPMKNEEESHNNKISRRSVEMTTNSIFKTPRPKFCSRLSNKN